jgi:glycine/D-amino acid oxidase-like deaminating enzyme
MIDSIGLWTDMDRRLGRATGYVKCGIVFSDRTDAQATQRQDWLLNLRNTGFRVEELTKEAMGARFGGSSFPATYSIFSPFDGRAEPQLAAPAIAEAARDRGALIFQDCAVTTIEKSGGKVSSVVTERGTIATSTAVIAAGAWSGALCENLNIALPHLDVLATAFRTTAINDGPDVSFGTGDFAVRRRFDGGYTVGSFRARAELVPNSFRYGWRFRSALRTPNMGIHVGKRFYRELKHTFGKAGILDRLAGGRTLDPTPWFCQDAVLDEVAAYFPFLRQARVAQAWAGCIDVTPEQIPVISTLGKTLGLHIASGFSGHGFGLAPGAGRLMADLITGRSPRVDPAPFQFSRYQR